MQNSGRSQSPAAGRHGVPAGFSYAGDPGEGKVARHREKTNRDSLLESASRTRESPVGKLRRIHAQSSASTHKGTRGLQLAKTKRPAPKCPPPSPRSLPYPHQAVCAAAAVGALGPRTQRAVVGKAAGAGALLEPERRERPGEGAAPRPPGRGRAGASLVPRGWSCGPHLAGAAIALLALFYKAVPAARLRHQEPGVRRVGEASAPSLSEEGAQLAAAASAKHAWERVPTGGGGRRACGDHHRQPLRVSNAPPRPSTLVLDQAAGRCADTACATDSSNSLEAEPREGK